MDRKIFQCTFLSDVILNSVTATEGSHKSLDYIPGSTFLGIVAKNYKNISNTYNMFHSGKVLFGDAHISKDKTRSLKRPASWFNEKGNDDLVYIHHYITDDMRQIFRSKVNPIQLKQIRSGYFIDSDLIPVEHNFAIKSAYNSDKRRSQDGQLFGYDALRVGTEWIFFVDSEDRTLLQEVVKYITGEHNIGKSKTSQYGRVKIEEIETYNETYKTFDNRVGNLILYFESCASFIDNSGNHTYKPNVEDLGLITGEIDWEKSQILTRSFAPWNGIRRTRDADKICIDKGSVIVVKNGKINLEKIKHGIGVYRNEGFGQIIVNPDFLEASTLTAKYAKTPHKPIKKLKLQTITKKNITTEDLKILEWIETKVLSEKIFSTVVAATTKFIDKNESSYKHILPSQWGGIRERALRITNLSALKDELFKDKTGYLRHGKSESKWKDKYSILEKAVSEVEPEVARHFLINLCSKMSKRIDKNESDGE